MPTVKACIDAVDELKLEKVAQMLKLPETEKATLAEQIQDWHDKNLAVPVQDYIACVRSIKERNDRELKVANAALSNPAYYTQEISLGVSTCLKNKNVLPR